MLYAHLFETKTEVVPGVFRCGGHDGLKVEILGFNEHRQAKIILGGEDHEHIFVGKDTADVLADFFCELSNSL